MDDPELARTFWYARVDGGRPEAYRPRFGKVAHLLQIPSVDLRAAVEEEKGSALTAEDDLELRERAEDARRWLARYAPESYKFEIQAALPGRVRTLSPAQQVFLAALAAAAAGEEWRGGALHNRIHELKSAQGLTAQEAFQAIYRAFLGKDSGPQAGWLLASLDREFVLARLRDAAGMRTAS
jgi:lysyl-tRNA synthetase class 1